MSKIDELKTFWLKEHIAAKGILTGDFAGKGPMLRSPYAWGYCAYCP